MAREATLAREFFRRLMLPVDGPEMNELRIAAGMAAKTRIAGESACRE
jgi:ABC-type nitrate/sulfonate/bicarbonate transport system permease component